MPRNDRQTVKQPMVRRPQVSKGQGGGKGSHGAQSAKGNGKR